VQGYGEDPFSDVTEREVGRVLDQENLKTMLKEFSQNSEKYRDLTVDENAFLKGLEEHSRGAEKMKKTFRNARITAIVAAVVFSPVWVPLVLVGILLVVFVIFLGAGQHSMPILM
jgi:hypothetical protein